MTHTDQPGRLAARRVILWAAAVVTLSLAVMAFASVRALEVSLEPEMEKRTQLIGATVREEIERAMVYGLPLETMGGASNYLTHILEQYPEIVWVRLVSKTGDVIASVQRADSDYSSLALTEKSEPVSLAMLHRNTIVGELRLMSDPRFVNTRMRNVLLDTLVVGVVAVLLAFEIVALVSANTLGKPLDRIFTLLKEQSQAIFQHVILIRDAGDLRRVARHLSDRADYLFERQGSAARPRALPHGYFVDVRLAVFLFSTATEISGAFLPLYAQGAGAPAWMTTEMAATAPLLAYLVAMALMAPFGGAISKFVSPRSLFLISVPLTAAAMVGVGLGRSVLAISLWHGAMALVYAQATIACQDYAIRTAPKSEVTQAIGGYLFVIIGGALCGAALGGVLADRIGASNTFFFGGALVVLSGLIGAKTMSRQFKVETSAAPKKSVTWSSITLLLFNRRFMALTIGVSVPVNIGMSVFIWYLTPVVLASQGTSVADIGRVVMLYYLAQILVGPTVAKLADGRVGNTPLLLCGILVGGVAITALSMWPGFWMMVVVVTAYGVGHSMCDATQYAHAIAIGEDMGFEGASDFALAALRLIERLAAIGGLVGSVVVVTKFGYDTATAGVGVLMLAGFCLMVLESTLRNRPRPAERAK